MKNTPLIASILTLITVSFSACQKHKEHSHHEHHKLIVTCPLLKDVSLTQKYVCQIHSSRHIEIRAIESGYLEAITVKEGQAVKSGDTMFKVLPTLYQAKLDAEVAEVQLAQIEFNNTKRLFDKNVVAQPEVALAQAKLAKAQAKMQLTQAELNFATIKAPFDGIMDHQHHQQGSLISEGDVLTTLSDNSVVWVYFNVPERDYLKFMASSKKERDELKVELMLADGNKFAQVGKIGAIEADFNNETGNIAFRADFQNPEGLLRHGQTGTVLISRILKDAIVIPQRAKFEILAKTYVYVVDASAEHQHESEDSHENQHAHGPKHVDNHSDSQRDDRLRLYGVVRQREIAILNELDDVFLIKDGLNVNDKIVLEGISQVRDGEEVEYEFRTPQEELDHLKYHAE